MMRRTGWACGVLALSAGLAAGQTTNPGTDTPREPGSQPPLAETLPNAGGQPQPIDPLGIPNDQNPPGDPIPAENIPDELVETLGALGAQEQPGDARQASQRQEQPIDSLGALEAQATGIRRVSNILGSNVQIRDGLSHGRITTFSSTSRALSIMLSSTTRTVSP